VTGPLAETVADVTANDPPAVRAAAEAIDAEFRDAECRSKPRWSRDLAIAALEAGTPHLPAAAAGSVPADQLAVAGLIAERATAAVAAINERFEAEVAKAVAAERERIASRMEHLAAGYPEDIFPANSDSRDGINGTAMRHAYGTAARLIREDTGEVPGNG
jgi:hypothetical protein